MPGRANSGAVDDERIVTVEELPSFRGLLALLAQKLVD
jgi:hypothetical protein